MEKIIIRYRQHLARMGKQSTRDDYGKRLSMLERFASMNGITAVENLDFVAFLDWVYIERGVSPRTHNNYRTWCRSFCKWMLHQHIIATDPMATNFPTLSGIDFCVIMLGTNDAPSVVEANSKEFIDQLISDYPNCKIAVGIPAYGRKCTNPLQKEKDIRVVSSIYLDKYDNGTYNANITCVGQGCWIDRLNDYPHEEIDSTPYSSDKIIRYTDSVHPSTQGYKQWGRAVYCKIRSWIAGNL